MAFSTREGLYIIRQDSGIPRPVKIDSYVSPRIIRRSGDYVCTYDGKTVQFYVSEEKRDSLVCDLDIIDIQFCSFIPIVVFILDSEGELYSYKLLMEDGTWKVTHMWSRVSSFSCQGEVLTLLTNTNNGEECLSVKMSDLSRVTLTGPTPVLGCRDCAYWGESWFRPNSPNEPIYEVKDKIKTAIFIRHSRIVYLNDNGEVAMWGYGGFMDVISRDAVELGTSERWVYAVNYDSELYVIYPYMPHVKISSEVTCFSGDSSRKAIKSA